MLRGTALAACLVLYAAPALAQQGALPVSALPLAGSPGTSAPSATDQIFVEQGVTLPGTGKAVRMPLSAITSLPQSNVAITGGTISGADVSGTSVTAIGASAARSPAAIAGDTINVKSMGAIGNGTTDDSTAINAAIATACAASPHKGVYFPNGNYDIKAANVDITCAPLRLSGDPGAVLIADAANTANPVLLRAPSQTAGNIEITGLTIDGNVAALCPAGNKSVVVNIFSSSYVKFDNDTIQNTCGLALQFSTSVKSSGIQNSRFYNTGMYWHTSGVQSDATSALVFLDNHTTWSASANSSGNFVLNNSFKVSGQDDLEFYGQAGLTIEGNTFDPGVGNQWFSAGVGDACLFGYANWGTKISNNYCSNSSANGFDLAGNANTTITGNTIYKAGLTGISVGTGRTYGLTNGDLNTTIVGNHEIDSGQTTSSYGVAIFNGPSGSGPQTVVGTIISANDAHDDQGTPTQAYGVGAAGSPGITGLRIDPLNYAKGNVSGATSPSLAPAASACGTSPAVGAGSSDLQWAVTIGSGTVTACTLTFASPFTQAPICTVSTNGAGAFAAITATSTTAITVGMSADFHGGVVSGSCR